ncbi:MAG: GTP-binding protein [Clostridiales bacterium]|jgi:G3E family GTPase|nr:GTP-binding protein [Clostridiales bacterium]
MRILLLGGFLGSGKTSILLQLAKHIISKEGKSGSTTVMIIENEIGDVSVDDKLLISQGLAVRDLFSGCACCTSGGDLLMDIQKIKDEINPKWIIIEATGVAYPRQIKESIEMYFHIPVKILCVADAKRWKRLRRAMSQLIEAQLELADCILLNKVDLVSEEEADAVLADIRTFNENAVLHKTTGILPVDEAVWEAIV